MAELQTDRRVPRGLGPEHEVPLRDKHAEAMFRYYHEPPTLAEHAEAVGVWIDHDSAERIAFVLADEPPTLAEHAELVQSDPLTGVPARGLLRIAWAATKAGFRDAWARLKNGYGWRTLGE